MRADLEQPDRAQHVHREKAEHGIGAMRRAQRSGFVCAEPCTFGLELDHDLAEHLAAFQPRDAALDIGKPDLGVDHGQ